MKYLIVTMHRGGPGEDEMMYPETYKPWEIERNKRGPIVYEGAFSLGESSEECMIYLSDAVADKYALDPDMRIVTEIQADTWLAANRELAKLPTEMITDAARLAAIEIKLDAGVELSDEDYLALDPDESMLGINRRKKTARAIFGG